MLTTMLTQVTVGYECSAEKTTVVVSKAAACSRWQMASCTALASFLSLPFSLEQISKEPKGYLK
jgi:hypothetical protein